jgi:hypothetical protein
MIVGNRCCNRVSEQDYVTKGIHRHQQRACLNYVTVYHEDGIVLKLESELMIIIALFTPRITIYQTKSKTLPGMFLIIK